MDDLVRRLREEVNDHMFGIIQSPLQLKAADRIEQLEAALRHCVNAISEWERKPEGVDGFLLGAMDNARAALGEKKDD
jgi:hypothetical protein